MAQTCHQQEVLFIQSVFIQIAVRDKNSFLRFSSKQRESRLCSAGAVADPNRVMVDTCIDNFVDTAHELLNRYFQLYTVQQYDKQGLKNLYTTNSHLVYVMRSKIVINHYIFLEYMILKRVTQIRELNLSRYFKMASYSCSSKTHESPIFFQKILTKLKLVSDMLKIAHGRAVPL